MTLSLPVIRRFAIIGTLLSGLSFYASAETIEQEFDVANGGTLKVKTVAGSIKVETHNKPTIEMWARIEGDSADDFELSYDTSGSDLYVKGELIHDRRWSSRLNVRFEFTVPENYNLDLNTAGGSINIDDLTGNVDAHTSGGSISIGNIRGAVDMHTSGGSINTEAVYGPLDAHTSGGSINVTFAEQLTEDAELNTSGGSINAYLIEDIQVDIHATTSGGRVRTDFDVDGKVKKRSIRGEINGGGPRLKLHTSGGSIGIRSL